jgi:hypothetical protein
MPADNEIMNEIVANTVAEGVPLALGPKRWVAFKQLPSTKWVGAVSRDRSRVVEGKCELHGERRIWCHSPFGKRQF